MATDLVVPLFESQSSNRFLDGIKQDKQRHQTPLPAVYVDIELPILYNSEESPLPCRESPEEFEKVISVFSEQVNDIFDALTICQREDAEALQPTTPHFSGNSLLLSIRVKGQQLVNPPYCNHRKYNMTRLTLKEPNALPQLSCVTKLRLVAGFGHGNDEIENVRPASLRLPLELLVHLPAVREFECPWGWEHMPIAYPSEVDCYWSRPWEGLWRDSRHDFGRAVQEMDSEIPASLKRVVFGFVKLTDVEDYVQSVPMPNLVHPADADPLSIGLRRLASHLEELDLRVILMPDIFDAQESSWPRMRRLRVEFHPMRSDGGWYFVGPRGEDPHPEGFHVQDEEHYPPTVKSEKDEEMDERYNDPYANDVYEVEIREPDMFRTQPHPQSIEPLLTTFAERLKCTPTIEEAELFAYLTWDPSDARQLCYENEVSAQPFELGVHRWGVKYIAAKGESKALVEWQVGNWRPATSIIELFETLGGNGGTEMTWKDFEFKARREFERDSAYQYYY